MFNCTLCGICCATVGKAISSVANDHGVIATELKSFPYKYDKSGRCEKLGDDNLCTVYDSRPDVCNVNKMHEKYFSKMSIESFYKLNEQHCHLLQVSIDKF